METMKVAVYAKQDISNNISNHFRYERYERSYFIENVIGGVGSPICSFMVDNGHRKGPSIHTITTNGIIVITNVYTKKLVTMLIARKGQITKYWYALNMRVPQVMQPVVNLAREHEIKRWNEI